MSFHAEAIILTETKLSQLRDEGEFCDVIIQVADVPRDTGDNLCVTFKAHKLILVASIPYFHALYADNQLDDVIALPACVEPLTFSIILDYIYYQPLSPRLIYSKLNHDPGHAVLPLSLVLEKLIATSTFLGLEKLSKRLTSWSNESSTVPFQEPVGVKREVDHDDVLTDIKYRVEEFGNNVDDGAIASSPAGNHFPTEVDDDEVVVKRDLGDLEQDAANSKLVVSVKRIDSKGVPKRRPGRPAKTDDDLAWAPSMPRKKRRRKILTLPKEKVKRERRDPSVKTRPKIPKGPHDRRKVLSRDLVDESMSIHKKQIGSEDDASNHFPTSSSETNSQQGMDLTSKSSTLDPESGILEMNGHPRTDNHDDASKGDDDGPNSSSALAKFKTMSSNDLKDLFKNPRDLQHVIKRRILAKVDRVEGDQNSWHHGVDHTEPFLGKVLPFGNASSKIWDNEEDGKKVHGEIRGASYKHELELKLEGGVVQKHFCRRVGNKFRCPFCEFGMAQPSSYKMGTHFLNNHGYVWIDFALLCNLCDFLTVTGKNLRDHLHRFHSVLQPRIERTLFLCRKCGKQFRFREGRHSHEKMCMSGREDGRKGRPSWLDKKPAEEEEEKPSSHICSECGKAFRAPMALENHMCREHGKARRFNCTQEGCTFGTNMKDPLYDHMFSAHQINVGAKPILQCQHCEYSTVRKHSFAKHQLTHGAQEYNIKCGIDGCEKTFRTNKDLRSHYRQCHVNLSLHCQYCESVFPTTQKLRVHEKIMHTHRVRNFKCAYCNHATVQRTNCRTHIKSVHRGFPVTVINLEKIGVTPAPEPPIARGMEDYTHRYRARSSLSSNGSIQLVSDDTSDS